MKIFIALINREIGVRDVTNIVVQYLGGKKKTLIALFNGCFFVFFLLTRSQKCIFFVEFLSASFLFVWDVFLNALTVATSCADLVLNTACIHRALLVNLVTLPFPMDR